MIPTIRGGLKGISIRPITRLPSLLSNRNYTIKMSSPSIPDKQNVVLFEKTGGPEVLEFVTDYPTPTITTNSNEIIVKNKYTGVNFIESYFRNGTYPCEKPYVLGREACGEVVAVGDGKQNKFSIGDKVVYLAGSSFAQYTKVDLLKNKVYKMSREASDESMQKKLAGFLQGLTVLTFVEEAYKVRKGDYALVWAAAGGVGLLFNQVLRKMGCHVIAISSTEEKLEKAKKNGAEFGILYDDPKLSEKIMEYTDGEGCDVVFDSIGKDTFTKSLNALKRKGTMVSLGQSSGLVPPVGINVLSAKNLKLLRPQLFGYITTEEEFQYYCDKLMKLIDSKDIDVDIFGVYDLKDYQMVTQMMEDRKTTGKILLRL